MNHGTRKVIPGTIWAIKMVIPDLFWWYRAIEYTAGKPSTNERIVETAAITIKNELHEAVLLKNI